MWPQVEHFRTVTEWAKQLTQTLQRQNHVRWLAEKLEAGTGISLIYNPVKNTITIDGSAGGATDLTYIAATRVLESSSGTDVTLPLVTSANAGLAPASGGGTSNFLRADATWAAPTLPAFSGALMEKTSDQSITSAGAAVSWDAESYDVGNWWTSGSPTRMTVPSGVTRIRITACCRTGTNNQNITGNLLKNGSDVFAGNPGGYSFSATGGVMLVSPVLEVVAGDYFEVFWRPPSTLNIIGGSGRRSWASIEAVQA
jgi:hypothetical protein